MPTFHEQIESIKRVADVSGSLGAGPQRDRTLKIVVKLKADAVGRYHPQTWLTDARLPALFSPYPEFPYPDWTAAGGSAFAAFDPQCLLYGVDYTNNNSNLAYVVYDYKYSTNPPVQMGSLPSALRRDPDASPPGGDMGFTFTHSSEELEIPYRLDASGSVLAYATPPGDFPPLAPQKVQNTAGDRYEQQPTKKHDVRVLTVQRLEVLYRRRFWDSFSFVKNKASWNGLPAGYVLSYPVQVGAWQTYGTTLVYPVTYTFKYFNDENYVPTMKPSIKGGTFWDDVLLSYGYQELDPTGDKSSRIRDDQGQPIKNPWGLDALGRCIRPQGSADPAETTYRKFLFADFSKLKITLPADQS